jgi:hypothetical protein
MFFVFGDNDARRMTSDAERFTVTAGVEFDAGRYQYREKGLTVTRLCWTDGRHQLSLSRMLRSPSPDEEKYFAGLFNVPSSARRDTSTVVVPDEGRRHIVRYVWRLAGGGGSSDGGGSVNQLYLATEPAEKRFLSVVGDTPRHLDELGLLGALHAAEVAAWATILELRGVITYCGAGRYCRR